MRHYDIAYVPNGPQSYAPVDYKKLSLEELKKKFLSTCGKCNGDVSVCSRCNTPCDVGKRAVQLVSEEVYSNPPVPLYGGKTLIEKAREENMKWRAAMEEQKKTETVTENKEENKEKKMDKIPLPDNWYEVSLASGDQVAWLMNKSGISKAKAKKKIYMYKYNHGLLKREGPTVRIEEEKPAEEIVETPEVKSTGNDSIEAKMEALMRVQEKHKSVMLQYQKLYEEAKQKYEEVKKKIDVLCDALDIMNDD